MSGTLLYNVGTTPINGPVVLATIGLLIIAVGCLVIFFRQRSVGALKPETRFVLLLIAALTAGTAVVAVVSVVPDLVRPPVVVRGRVLKEYDQVVDPDNEVYETRVTLSSGTDVTIPDALKGKLALGTCVELTTTPATGYVLIARQLAPDACLTSQ